MGFNDSAVLKNRVVNAGIIVLALIIAAKVYQGRVNEMNRIKDQQEEERKKNNLLGNIQGLEQKLNAYTGILRDRDEGVIMNTVNAVAQESGIKIESLRPGAQQRFEQYTRISFLIDARGADYHTFGRFISKIESHQVVFIVERVHIRKEPMKQELAAQIVLATVSLNN